MPTWSALPANWHIWSILSSICCKLTLADSGVETPLSQVGVIIHASKTTPTTPFRAIISFSCSSVNCLWWSTNVLQLLWLAQRGPS